MYNQIVLCGIIISLLYTEITGLSAGLVVSGYLLLSLNSPIRIIYTIAVSLIAMFITKIFSRYVILYGRRRFAFLILLTFIIGFVVDRIKIIPGGVDIIGYVIPGIIARECDRQGVFTTILSLVIVTSILGLVVFLLM